VAEIGRRLGLETLLAVMQILDQTLYRMRYSTQSRILAELALVRISRLENLDELTSVIEQLRLGQPRSGAAASVPATAASSAAAARPSAAAAPPPATAPAAKKKYDEPVDSSGPNGGPVLAAGLPGADPTFARHGEPSVQSSDLPDKLVLSPSTAAEVWKQALLRLSGFIVDHARQFQSLAVPSANRLVVCFKPDNAFGRSTCQRPENAGRIEDALAEVTGQPVRVEFALAEAPAAAAAPQASPVPAHLKVLQAAKNPLVRLAGELFGAQPIRVDDPPEKT
jgi:DNA polymerase-3 subunit gamma/tau